MIRAGRPRAEARRPSLRDGLLCWITSADSGAGEDRRRERSGKKQQKAGIAGEPPQLRRFGRESRMASVRANQGE